MGYNSRPELVTPPAGTTASPTWSGALRRAQVPLKDDESVFLSSLPVINDVVAQVCRRHRLTADESDEFAAEVRLQFIERRYEPLRRFEGRSSLRTYLTVVIQRLFLDYRNRLWGKWRPTAEARRLGPHAIQLERLVIRDGWNVEPATELLKTNYGVNLDEGLSALCLRLAQRQPSRQVVPESEAADVEGALPPADAHVVRAEHDFLAKRVHAALDRARQTLAPEERLILRMRFDEGVPVADIARALHLNQKRLYRTIEQMLTRLRQRLEADGISKEEIGALFSDGSLGRFDRITDENADVNPTSGTPADARTA